MKKEGAKEGIDITAEEFKAWTTAHWAIAPEHRMKRFGHPAMFPEQLAERIIRLFSYRGDTVLDPYNGAGTTTTVAKRLGRSFLGIDISPKYCDTARERLTEEPKKEREDNK